MTKVPVLNAKQVIKKARKAGFIFDRQAKGSHEIWYHPIHKKRFTIAVHAGRTPKLKTMKSIITQMGLTIEEFNKL